LNFEISKQHFTKRIITICAALKIPPPKNLDIFNLRGRAGGWKAFMRDGGKLLGYAAAMIDPLYKVGRTRRKLGGVPSAERRGAPGSSRHKKKMALYMASRSRGQSWMTAGPLR
jgi:hypothetical protein